MAVNIAQDLNLYGLEVLIPQNNSRCKGLQVIPIYVWQKSPVASFKKIKETRFFVKKWLIQSLLFRIVLQNCRLVVNLLPVKYH